MGKTFSFVSDTGVFSKSGVDFGTYVLLETLCELNLDGSLLDLGCGYGVIGIVLKTWFPTLEVTCSDINTRAVELTELNAKRNNVQLNTQVSDGFDRIKQKLDIVVTNPPIRAGKQVIYKMFRDAYEHLNAGGTLYVVIRKQQGAESAKHEIADIFGECETIAKKKGYWILMAKK